MARLEVLTHKMLPPKPYGMGCAMPEEIQEFNWWRGEERSKINSVQKANQINAVHFSFGGYHENAF